MNENVQAEAITESVPQADIQPQTSEEPAQPSALSNDNADRLVNKGYAKGYKKAKEEFHVEQPQAQQYQQQAQVQQAPMDQSQNMREIAKQAALEAQKEFHTEQQQLFTQQQAEQQQQKMYEGLAAKANEAKTHYEDFDETMQSVGYLDNLKPIQEALNGFENGGHMLYDLAKNPSKVAEILTLAQHDPSIAYSQLQRLSDSIKTNQSAKGTQRAPEPLSPINASNVGMDNGQMTVADFKKIYRG